MTPKEEAAYALNLAMLHEQAAKVRARIADVDSAATRILAAWDEQAAHLRAAQAAIDGALATLEQHRKAVAS